MGVLMLENILSVMNAGGIRTRRACPGSVMPAVESVVAAVSTQSVDLTKGTTEMKVLILCHSRLGAGACEDTALAAARALQAAGYCCRVEAVDFDGRSGLFSAEIFVTTPEKPVQTTLQPFRIGAVAQQYAVSFTAQRELAEEETDLEKASWTVRLEQFFPTGEEEDGDPSGSEFTLTNGTEIYHGCRWVSQKRVTEADGTRQIREGTAMSRTFL